MKVILISAKSQHGKDTVAKMIKEELETRGEKILIIHFGDPVKWFARELYNWNGEKDERGRALLQYIGTTLMRSYDKYYWGDIISKYLAAIAQEENYTYAIIPDWRFYSEEEAIRTYNENVSTIRITRINSDGTLYRNPQMTDEQFYHISETELDNYKFNWTILNASDLEWLRQEVIMTLNHIDKQ